MMFPSTTLVFLFYWLLHRLHDATIYRDTGRKWECTTNVPSFGPDYYMQSQLVGNYSEKLCLSFFPLICYLRQLWHDKRAWKGLEQQINVTDTKHLKLSFSLTTSAHSPLNNLGCTYILFKPDFFLVSMNFILIEFRLNLFYSCQFLATHCKFRTRCDASASFFMNHQRYYIGCCCYRIWIRWRGVILIFSNYEFC